jgi:hypothetical protein
MMQVFSNVCAETSRHGELKRRGMTSLGLGNRANKRAESRILAAGLARSHHLFGFWVADFGYFSTAIFGFFNSDYGWPISGISAGLGCPKESLGPCLGITQIVVGFGVHLLTVQV